MTDIRWLQRLSSFKKALAQLQRAVALRETRVLSELEQQGLIQAFEFTHELAWNVMKDFLTDQDGGSRIAGSKDTTRAAFSRDLISDGDTWMQMIASRNASSHTYDVVVADALSLLIANDYAPLFHAFLTEMEKRSV